VTAWQPPGQPPVIWMSRESRFAADQPIRGGVPICFPWFGPKAGDASAPAHGFARLKDWALTDVADQGDSVRLVLTLSSDESSSVGGWTQPFAAAYQVTIGASLELALTVRNTGKGPLSYEAALHTYFAVANVREIAIRGLEHTYYLDKVEGFARRQQGGEPIRFAGETDRVYLDTMATCVIEDPGTRREIVIEKTGSRTTVVWNPWIEKARAMPDFGDLEWPEMVCVETCNVGPAAITLAPGGTQTMAATIRARKI
jgi:glucose-6-phosphate 1-epimerase